MTSSFHETQFPTDISRGAVGGPGFHTTILTLSSGFEKRNIDWSRSRATYKIGYGVRHMSEVQQLLAFYMARYGQAYGFRFKDWSDYQIWGQQIGTANSQTTAFQIVKVYGDSAGYTYTRQITKPVSGTVKIGLAVGTCAEGTDYDIDYTTGIVTFRAGHVPPTSAGAISVTYGEFDVPVRFNTDLLELNIEHYDAGSLPNIELVEVRV